MTWKGKWPGTWATVCDVCGLRFPSDKLHKRWDGLMTCSKDWEQRHPQDFIKIKPEKIAPDFVRPESYQYTVNVCTQTTIQGQADIGVADCAQADRHLDNFMQFCPLNPTSIASIALAGCMVAGTPRHL